MDSVRESIRNCFELRIKYFRCDKGNKLIWIGKEGKELISKILSQLCGFSMDSFREIVLNYELNIFNEGNKLGL